MQSPHPYPANTTYQAIFQHPISVEGDNHILTYDEIVLIEPGESADPFDPRFYDYVAVEASIDRGSTWSNLARYDAQSDPEWLSAYNLGTVASSLYKSREIDLRSRFDEGDEILLRFTLVSDPGAEGWGWSIDNINILSDQVTSSSNLLDIDFKLKIRPNPFDQATDVRYTLEKRSDVQFEVFDLTGKRLFNHTAENVPQGINTQRLELGHSPAGTYVGILTRDQGRSSFRLVKQ